ncbi:PH domain-containing protein [Polaribacter sp.]|uniref:PH domain-containing protein n=1 Tax=Polaribacter sp. TaxID=1920175 RepID=UPI003F6D59C5
MTDSFQNIAITTFPEIAKIDFKNIEKSYLKVILINVTLVFLVLFALLFITDFIDFFELHFTFLWFYISLFIVYLLVIFIKIIGFKKRKYAVREKDVSYKKGVFFRSLTTVPFNRIQHVEIDQGPIARFFNLVSLSVFTAGDSSDDLKISGLLQEDAQKMKEYISNQIDG